MKNQDNPLEGVELLRRAAHWTGDRHEYLNDNKSANELIAEFQEYLKEYE